MYMYMYMYMYVTFVAHRVAVDSIVHIRSHIGHAMSFVIHVYVHAQLYCIERRKVKNKD